PKTKQIRHFDKQLLIEAIMAEAGGFENVPGTAVGQVTYIKVGRSPEIFDVPLGDEFKTVTVKGELSDLLAHFQSDSVGYISRRAMEKMRYEGDFDHLARFGEWDASERSVPGPVK
ncbi:MAG: double-strand break repair protein AddB, partial [Silicimonas sp.]|nr:double-strand break repair protein AddB [Silicimonas sp.]